MNNYNPKHQQINNKQFREEILNYQIAINLMTMITIK